MDLPSRYSLNGSEDVTRVSAKDLYKVERPGFINWNNTPDQVSFNLRPNKPTINANQLDAKKFAGKGYVVAKSMHGYGDDVPVPAAAPTVPLTAPQASEVANPVVVTAPVTTAVIPAAIPAHHHKLVCMLVCVALGAVIACMVCKRK